MSHDKIISLFIFKPNGRGVHYGIGTYLKYLTDILLRHGDIKIYMINYLSDRFKEFTIETIRPGIKEIFIPSPLTSINREEQIQKYSNRIIDLLIPIFLKYNNTVFQTNSPDTLPIVKHLKKRFSLKIISVIHSTQWQFAFNGNKNKFIRAWLNKKEADPSLIKVLEEEKELYEFSDKIISVTQYMKDFLIKYFNISKERIEVIPNGLDHSLFKRISKEERESVKHNLGFYNNEKIILFIGRLDKWKGLYFLLDAFAEVCNQYEYVRLVLIGEDSGSDRISQYLTHCKNIWSRVTFTSFIDSETIQKFYKIADIGIIPSLYDHCPYVALEMIANNLPLILTNTEGLNEILTRDQCIYITPSNDDDGNLVISKNEITQAILKLLRNDNEISKKITIDYHKLIRTKYSIEQMGKKMYSLLHNLV